MYEKEVFTVEHSHGFIKVNVGVFFGTLSKKDANKLLRFARQLCNDDRRLELIAAMKRECDFRTEVLDTLGELEYQRRVVLADLFTEDVSRPLAAPEKALVKQREKMKAHIESLEKERWQD